MLANCTEKNLHIKGTSYKSQRELCSPTFSFIVHTPKKITQCGRRKNVSDHLTSSNNQTSSNQINEKFYEMDKQTHLAAGRTKHIHWWILTLQVPVLIRSHHCSNTTGVSGGDGRNTCSDPRWPRPCDIRCCAGRTGGLRYLVLTGSHARPCLCEGRRLCHPLWCLTSPGKQTWGTKTQQTSTMKILCLMSRTSITHICLILLESTLKL